MEKKVSKKAKRRFAFLTICVFGLFTYLVGSLANSWSIILDNNKEMDKLETEYAELLEQEEALKSEVTKLQDPDYIARYASEKYLYSKDGLTIIRIID